MADNCIIVFAKYPHPGKVKTRLAKYLGDRKAANIARSFIKNTLQEADRTERTVVLAVSDQKDLGNFRKWLGADRIFIIQKGQDLGSRMKNAFDWSFDAGYINTVLIGTDCPERNSAVIKGAFNKLRKSSVVLGPAFDGGYYLIGFNTKGFCPEVFSAVQWGTPKVMAQTLAKLKKAKRSVALIKRLHDVDTAEDLKYFN